MSTSPVWLLLFSQRLMVERETPKSSWTSLLRMPRSMAASAFNLRSFEYAFMSNILAWVRYLRKLLLELLQGEVRTFETALYRCWDITLCCAMLRLSPTISCGRDVRQRYICWRGSVP